LEVCQQPSSSLSFLSCLLRFTKFLPFCTFSIPLSLFKQGNLVVIDRWGEVGMAELKEQGLEVKQLIRHYVWQVFCRKKRKTRRIKESLCEGVFFA
jgi:hypothetical protein